MVNNVVIVGKSAPDAFVRTLEEYGKTVIMTEEHKGVNSLVKGHVDTVMCKIDEKTVVVCPEMYESVSKRLCAYGIDVIKGERRLAEQYPEDIAYNVAIVGEYAFLNTKYTDPVLKSELVKRGITLLDVKQGYAACSVMAVGDRALISADKSILKAAEQTPLCVLEITQGYVLLRGAEYGFFGGSGGVVEDTLFVAGSLKNHPDKERIEEFVIKHNKNIVYTDDCDLTDIGSLF